MNCVGVGEEQPLARGRGGSRDHCVVFSRPACRQRRRRNYCHALEIFRDLARAVGRSIIHDYDFEGHTGLRYQRLQAVSEVRFFVPGWNDDRDFGL